MYPSISGPLHRLTRAAYVRTLMLYATGSGIDCIVLHFFNYNIYVIFCFIITPPVGRPRPAAGPALALHGTSAEPHGARRRGYYALYGAPWRMCAMWILDCG